MAAAFQVDAARDHTLYPFVRLGRRIGLPKFACEPFASVLKLSLAEARQRIVSKPQTSSLIDANLLLDQPLAAGCHRGSDLTPEAGVSHQRRAARGKLAIKPGRCIGHSKLCDRRARELGERHRSVAQVASRELLGFGEMVVPDRPAAIAVPLGRDARAAHRLKAPNMRGRKRLARLGIVPQPSIARH